MKFYLLLTVLAYFAAFTDAFAKDSGKADPSFVASVETAIGDMSAPWLTDSLRQDLKELTTRLKSKNSSRDLAIASLEGFFAKYGVFAPVILAPSDLLHWQITQTLPMDFIGVTQERRGKSFYVKYALPYGLKSDTRLLRGDQITRLAERESAASPELTLRLRPEPIAAPKTIAVQPSAQNYRETMKIYSEQSMQRFNSGDKKLHYLHVLDCSDLIAPVLAEFANKSAAVDSVIIDLRDSFCLSSTMAAKLISELPSKTKVYFLQNQQTRMGAEDLIIAVKKLRQGTLTIGEPTRGFQNSRQQAQLHNRPEFLYLPSQLSPGSPSNPDYRVKDSFIFAQGKDDLLSAALAIMADQN